jgi:hypothetical protein
MPILSEFDLSLRLWMLQGIVASRREGEAAERKEGKEGKEGKEKGRKGRRSRKEGRKGMRREAASYPRIKAELNENHSHLATKTWKYL